MQKKYKEGYVREDGMVFWRITKRDGEIWISAEKYEQRKKQRKEYRAKCRDAYKQIRGRRNVMDIPYFGKYDFSKNRYYAGVSCSGKEIWTTKEKLEKLKAKQRASKTRYIERAKMLPQSNMKIGDRHPSDPNLFVIFKIGNKIFYGDKERLEKKLQSLKLIQRKRYIKMQKMRREIMGKMEKKFKRGDIDSSTGMIFWQYNRVAKPIWLDKCTYDLKRKNEKEKKARNRLRKATVTVTNHEDASLNSSATSEPVSG